MVAWARGYIRKRIREISKVTRQRKLPAQMLSHLDDDISLSALCRVLKGQECESRRGEKERQNVECNRETRAGIGNIKKCSNTIESKRRT